MACAHKFKWGPVSREHCEKCSATLYEQDIETQLKEANEHISNLKEALESANQKIIMLKIKYHERI